MLGSGEPPTFPPFHPGKFTGPSSPSLESPFCNLTSIFCAAVCPEGTQMWSQRWESLRNPSPLFFPLSLLASQISETLSGLPAPCSSAPIRCLISVCCIESSPYSFPFALQLPALPPSVSPFLSPAPYGFLLPLPVAPNVTCPVSLFVCVCLPSLNSTL